MKSTSQNYQSTLNRKRFHIAGLLRTLGYTVQPGTLHNRDGQQPRVSRLITPVSSR